MDNETPQGVSDEWSTIPCKPRQNRLCWLSPLNKAPLGVIRDGAQVGQSVRASAGARLKIHP